MDKVTSIEKHKQRVSNEGDARKNEEKADELKEMALLFNSEIIKYWDDIDRTHLLKQIDIYNTEIVRLRMRAARLRCM